MDFQKLEISTSGPVQRPNVRHRAKFREDRSNRSRDMADFRFSRWRPSANLDFQKLQILTPVQFGTPMCIILPIVAEFSRTVTEIWPIFDFSRWRPSAILDFQTLEISTSGPVRRPNVRHRAKFR